MSLKHALDYIQLGLRNTDSNDGASWVQSPVSNFVTSFVPL